MPNCPSSPTRSASAASFSRSWCAPARADNFEIIAGERRWRAAQRAGLHEVPIVVLDVTDGEALELAIIENVQRADLNPLEEATGYQSLANEFNHSQDDIAKIVGKSRSHIANTLRLLQSARAREGLHQFRQAHGRACAHAGRSAERRRAGGSDRQPGLERAPGRGAWRARAAAARRARARRTGRLGKDADTEALEKRLTNALGLLVTIDHRANGGGMLQVRYRTLEQLDDVIATAGTGAERSRRLATSPSRAFGSRRSSIT